MAKTLLQMAGANLARPALAGMAVVVVDAQREYVDGALPLPDVRPALAVIGGLLARARKLGAPVVHVRHRGRAGGLFDPATAAFGIAAEAAPAEGEAVIDKALPNAFAGTTLQETLDALGRRPIVLAGFMTHMCISATARAALDLGFQSVVLSDATATRDLPDPLGGGVVSARDLHRAELAGLADRFSLVCAAADLPDRA